MYTDYWNLKEMPFENTPGPRFLYRSVGQGVNHHFIDKIYVLVYNKI